MISSAEHPPREATAGAVRPASGRRLALALWIAAAVLLLVRVVAFSDRHLVVDDAYISFRYAANLADGHGLVFNPGEKVEGYTNFLWTVMLAAGAAAGVDLVRLSQVLGGLSALGVLVLLAATARRLLPAELPARPLLLALPALLWAGMGSQAQLAGSGMESIFFVFWVFLAVELLFVRERPGAASLAFALAALTRPEGGLYGLLAGLLCLGSVARAPAGAARRAAWRRALVLGAGFALVYLPYFLWRYQYYGYPFPNTFYAKVGGMSAERLDRGWTMLVDLVGSWGVLPFVLAALASLATPRGRRAGVPFWTLTAASAAYFVIVGGDLVPFFGPRFLLPALPLVLLLVPLGIGALAGRLPRPGLRRGSAWALSAALFAWALLFTSPKSAVELRWLEYEMEGWERLGRWMASSLPDDASVAVGAAGIVPFYTGAPTIDMYGLVDEAIAHMPARETGFIRVAHEKFAPRYVLERRPDSIVTYLTPRGRPATAGLALVGRDLWRCYAWRFQVRVAEGAADDAPWLLPVDAFSPPLYEQGYRAALLQRRPDPPAGC